MPPSRLFIILIAAFCRLAMAKSFLADEMVGRGGRDRTNELLLKLVDSGINPQHDVRADQALRNISSALGDTRAVLLRKILETSEKRTLEELGRIHSSAFARNQDLIRGVRRLEYKCYNDF